MSKSYGKLSLTGGIWTVEAEPHTVLRIRKSFGQPGRADSQKCKVYDTPDNCLELEWILIRFPMESTHLEYLHERAAQRRKSLDEVDDLIQGRAGVAEFPTMVIQPRDYQRIAASIALKSGGLLIADDVGLGKTAMGLAVASHPETWPALAVTLAGVMPLQWADEAARFAPSLKVHVLKGTKPYDLGSNGDAPNLIITNYHKLHGWADYLSGKVKTLIADEAQEFRRNESARYAAAEKITAGCTYRVALSATPIFNYGSEMFNVMQIVKPNCLGSRSTFYSSWCKGEGAKAKVTHPAALGAMLRENGLLIRRTRKDVGRELPAVQIIPHRIDCDIEYLKTAESEAAALAELILSSDESSKNERWIASERLSTLLRQITGIAKAPFVADFVRLLVESGERVLLYGWHRGVYEIWMNRLANLNPLMYTGSESQAQKSFAKAEFIAGRRQLLIMSNRAGAGVDGFQKCCRTVVVGELDWTWAVHEQGIGRVARDGQPDPVSAYFLLSDRGCDPAMAKVLDIKNAQLRGIRDLDETQEEKFKPDDDRIRQLAQDYLEQRKLKSDEGDAA